MCLKSKHIEMIPVNSKMGYEALWVAEKKKLSTNSLIERH